MKKSIMPYVLRGISSDFLRDSKRSINGIKRSLSNSKPALSVFIKADDPYSYLLLQALGEIKARFDIDLSFHVFSDIDPEMYPRMDMLNSYAKHDAFHLAQLYDYKFPAQNNLPDYSEKDIEAASIALANIEDKASFVSEATEILENFWFKGEAPNIDHIDTQKCTQILADNHIQLSEQGHYLGAMIHFEGEWYWGIDRLDHLEKRLIEIGVSYSPEESIRFDKTYADLCVKPALPKASSNETFTLYWSARSPYSYIGLEQAIKLTEHYGIPLEIKPVLPMVMRGMSVPGPKKLYIFLDTKREATKLGLPYGFLADPLGAAVERCYALVDYAKSENKLQEFLLHFARAVNSQGVRAETDKGMKLIIDRCGLNWDTAKSKLQDQSWRDWAQQNLDEMFELGCWGVPTIRYGELSFWGQDRFGIIENHIRSTHKNYQA